MSADATSWYTTAAEMARAGIDLYPVTDRAAAKVADRTSGTTRAAAERAAILADPGFGRHFTDHMVRADWTAGAGWAEPELVDYAPLTLDPAAIFIHYGQSIFEGLKAYRHGDGALMSFRPEANARRFARSARRMGMAELPEDVFLGAVEALVRADAAWIADDPEKSLYLRPFQFATEVGLGVRPANAYTFLLIGSPAGAYFPRGVQPVSVWLSTEFTRAAPGGTGEAKCSGNYAASLIAQAHAAEQGCDQVVWLDAVERRWVEEMGGMNLVFVHGSGDRARLVTPELTGTLLPGITRDSLLKLARHLGIPAEEGRISIEQWQAGNASGEISEVFACGTAAVVTPVGSVKSATASWTVGDGQPGPITMRLRHALLELQTGRAEDPFGWVHRIA
ncbi:MAG: branched-chain amino acid aminotransferase [Candidatus Nanopelagicales bacterium]|jgi:branched-chain amino acid aminotransferase|nr:branched-chain amino acid aminotransferase [Candidatus Nanopelagicales bacterium]